MKGKWKGPVFQRRTQVDAMTTDQRLLDTRGATDWVHTDPWRVVTQTPVGEVASE